MSKTGHPDISSEPSCSLCSLPASAYATCQDPACLHKDNAILAAAAPPVEVLADRADFEVVTPPESPAVHIAGRPKADGGGMRFNAGKNQLELIPIEWIWGLGMVLTRGAAKYAVRNWERGMAWSYPIGCALRHILKFACGERYDKETGCHHLFMAAWNCCALATYDIRGIGTNDLGEAKLEWLDAVATTPGPELLAIIEEKTRAAEAKMKAKADEKA